MGVCVCVCASTCNLKVAEAYRFPCIALVKAILDMRQIGFPKWISFDATSFIGSCLVCMYTSECMCVCV